MPHLRPLAFALGLSLAAALAAPHAQAQKKGKSKALTKETQEVIEDGGAEVAVGGVGEPAERTHRKSPSRPSSSAARRYAMSR